MADNQISSGLRLIVDLNLNKFNDMLLIRPKYDKFPPNDFLPNYQLSIFSQILQILFGYTHPNLSGDQVSNRIDNEWPFENEKVQMQASGFTFLGWYMIWKSHGFYPVDMLVFKAATCNSDYYSFSPKS